jgi:hypothetical protein
MADGQRRSQHVTLPTAWTQEAAIEAVAAALVDALADVVLPTPATVLLMRLRDLVHVPTAEGECDGILIW